MTVTKKDIFKHYGASVIIYGLLFLFMALCPFFNEGIDTLGFNYVDFFFIYYILYIIAAPVILFIKKPESVLESRTVAIFSYFKRQFKRNITLEERINNIEPLENEKQSMVILFIQSFFGVFCVNLLCNKILPSIGYDFDFLKEMFSQAIQYAHTSGPFMGLLQYIDDTSDMWLVLILGLTTFILGFSYLTESTLFKNKIKSVDTTPLGIISCIMCYYPIKAISDKIIPSYLSETIQVENLYLRISISLLLVIAQFIILISVLKLGTKSGNLTNRGIVTGFPYNIVRHPDYAMQVFSIILLSIPVFLYNDIQFLEKVLLFIGVFCWAYVYYLRAMTEERHLLKDSEYQKYSQRTKYRFIPKLF